MKIKTLFSSNLIFLLVYLLITQDLISAKIRLRARKASSRNIDDDEIPTTIHLSDEMYKRLDEEEEQNKDPEEQLIQEEEPLKPEDRIDSMSHNNL